MEMILMMPRKFKIMNTLSEFIDLNAQAKPVIFDEFGNKLSVSQKTLLRNQIICNKRPISRTNRQNKIIEYL
jgi:hypothetical protein